ncbi:hypothetical protein BH09PSE4_BH09PSE4_17800 [soil metagenome]
MTPPIEILYAVPVGAVIAWYPPPSTAPVEVAAATAADEGVLTPMPCVPATMTPWIPGAPRVTTEGMPVLCSGSICACDWLGEISIDEPGQMRVSVQA